MKKPNTPDTPVRLLARMAASALRGNDLEPEELPEVASLLETVAGIAESGNSEEPEIRVTRTEAEITAGEEPTEQPAEAADADPEIISRLDRIISLLEARAEAAAADEAAPEGGETEPAPEAEKVEEEMENLEEAVAELISAEEAEEETAPEAEPGADDGNPDENGESGFLSASDRMVRAAVRALKPVIARLPEKERASAADAALRAMRSLPKGEKPPRSAYAALAGAARAEDPGDLGRRIISSRNINYRK